VQTPQGFREESRQDRYVVYLPSFADRYARRLILSGQGTTDEDLAPLSNHEELRCLDLTGATVTDAGLESLADIDTLEALVLAGTHITDAGMQQVGQIEKLVYLDLSNLSITDEGLRALHGLEHLKRLVLDGTEVTSDRVGALLQATPIKDLSLDRTAVDDSLAVQLEGSHLGVLSASQTKATRRGIDNIWEVHPDCAIRYEWPPIGGAPAVPGTAPQAPTYQPLPGPSSPSARPAAGPAPSTSALPPRRTGADYMIDESTPMTLTPIPELTNGYSVAEAKVRLDAAEREAERVRYLIQEWRGYGRRTKYI
jgi:hypothetical protein